MLDGATAHQAAQHPLDHGAKRPPLSDEALGPDEEQLLETLLDQVEGG